MNVCYAVLVWKQDGRFCRVPMLSQTGCAGLRKKGFCYIGCSCLPRRKIATHCLDVGSTAIWSRLVFDVVL